MFCCSKVQMPHSVFGHHRIIADTEAIVRFVSVSFYNMEFHIGMEWMVFSRYETDIKCMRSHQNSECGGRVHLIQFIAKIIRNFSTKTKKLTKSSLQLLKHCEYHRSRNSPGTCTRIYKSDMTCASKDELILIAHRTRRTRISNETTHHRHYYDWQRCWRRHCRIESVVKIPKSLLWGGELEIFTQSRHLSCGSVRWSHVNFCCAHNKSNLCPKWPRHIVHI